MMTAIPPFVIEYFLLGRTRRDAIERYTQDGGIVLDVWLAFATDQALPQRVLVAPSQGTSAIVLGYALHKAIAEYRQSPEALQWLKSTTPAKATPPARDSPGVSPLVNFVAVTLYFDELLRIVLPLTTWWHKKHLSALRRSAEIFGGKLAATLQKVILQKLGHDPSDNVLWETLP